MQSIESHEHTSPTDAKSETESQVELNHQQSLLKTGALQDAIFNSANFSSIATDAKGVIQIFNVGAERMLGYAAADVVNKITPAAISDPLEVIARACALSQELGTSISPGFDALVFKASRGIEDIYELTYIRKDGSRFPAVVSVTALRDAQDTIIGYLLIGTDNTARKLAEQALVKAGALQRAIFNSTHFSSIATDAKGVIQIFNVGAERMLGFDAADVMNKLTPAELSDPREVILRAKALSEEFCTPISPGFEALVYRASRGIEDIYDLTYIRKDGSRFPAIVSVTALCDAKDAIIGYLLIGTDNTARSNADLVLREYKAIIDASDDAIISKSLDGTIKSWNHGAERLFGYTADDVIGQSMQIVMPLDRPDEESEILTRLSGGERIEHFETIRRCKDGHLVNISATISPIFDGGNKLVAASEIARNITESKQAEALRASLEEQLRESQKMEAIGTLAGGIAHDFNNIIATILGNADLALEDTAGNTSAQKSLEEICKAGRRARDLVQQILSFSRRQPMLRKPMALAPIIEESVRLMRATFPANVAVSVRCEVPVPDVMADATQIEQVLLNLATNSVQAARNGSQHIEICLDTVVLDASFANGHPAVRSMHLASPALTARLTLSDRGPGMDAGTLARIFEPFFTTKQTGEGTGLGLSVVRGIMQAHEGAISVASQPGASTTFTLYLPIAPLPPLADRGTEHTGLLAEQLRGGGLRLLYIDDDVALVDLVERRLARHGYVVTGYDDARKAIENLRRDPTAFDLVVTDYNMPYLSGLDVARAILEIRPDLPVGIVSGFIDERLLSQAKGAVARELIVKTSDVAEFSEALYRLGQSIVVAGATADL